MGIRVFAVALVMGCASPVVHVRDWRGTGYEVRYADPMAVNSACYTPGAKLDDGRPHRWDGSWCGCVFHKAKVVWIARRHECDKKVVEDHEYAHIIEHGNE